jgi:hypothetical protein
MTDSPTCAACHQPILVKDSVYFWPDRQTMEHLWCHARWVLVAAEMDVSADPVFGPMS